MKASSGLRLLGQGGGTYLGSVSTKPRIEALCGEQVAIGQPGTGKHDAERKLNLDFVNVWILGT